MCYWVKWNKVGNGRKNSERFWNDFLCLHLNICGFGLEINDRTQRQKQRLGEEIKIKIVQYPHLTDVLLYFSSFLSLRKIVSFPKHSEKLENKSCLCRLLCVDKINEAVKLINQDFSASHYWHFGPDDTLLWGLSCTLEDV